MPPHFEEVLAFVAAHLSAPVAQTDAPDGSIYLTGGDPGEVIVRLTRSGVVVWEYAVAWEGPHAPVPRPIRVGGVIWARLPAERGMAAIVALMDGARGSRLGKFGTCTYCDSRKPPEWMHDASACQSCAERHLGIVY